MFIQSISKAHAFSIYNIHILHLFVWLFDKRKICQSALKMGVNRISFLDIFCIIQEIYLTVQNNFLVLRVKFFLFFIVFKSSSTILSLKDCIIFLLSNRLTFELRPQKTQISQYMIVCYNLIFFHYLWLKTT